MTTIRVVRAADTIGGNCIEITARTGERILYSGDFRAHGRKSALTKRFLAPPRQVIHTSGHAGPDVLRRFARAVRPACIIPIHGQYTAENQTAISGLYAPIPVRFVQNGEEVIL